MNQFEPTPEQWDDILKKPTIPTSEDLANRSNPDDVADMSGANILAQQERKILDRQAEDNTAMAKAREIIERIKKGLK